MTKYLVIPIACLILLGGCASKDAIEDQVESVQVKVESRTLEINDMSETEKITLINKWHKDLYESENFMLLSVLLNGYVIDPELTSIVKNQNFGELFNIESVNAVSEWALNEIAHTQTLGEFKSEKGKDPWGVSNGIPTYKKLLPSEMSAMSMFSNKYTGKCTSITNSLYSIMRLLGMNSDSGVILRLDSHTMAVFKVEDRTFAIDNNYIIELDEKTKEKVASFKYYGFYNDRISHKGSIKITKEMLDSKKSIIEEIVNGNEIEENELYVYSEGDAIKYVIQSLEVENPSIYLDAAKLGPNTLGLSEKLNDADSIFSWISENINTGHLLQMNDSIQTADQTLVFRSGSNYDKGLLASALMELNEIECELVLTGDNAYIKYDKKIYSIGEEQVVESIKTNVLYTLK